MLFRSNRFTLDELMEELRMKGVTDLSTVKYAILETNGQLSVLPFTAQKPPTAQDLDLHLPEPGLPVVMINDGRVITRNLHSRGLDEVWLDKQLQQHHVKRTQDVFLLTVDETNKVCVIKKEAVR